MNESEEEDDDDEDEDEDFFRTRLWWGWGSEWSLVTYQMMEELNAFTNGSLVCKCTDKGLKWRETRVLQSAIKINETEK
ncbi:hypothetical protein L3X38_036144 [Prunus dulcis]|uniref:Uncharacterized protein n=1 Tax=Prunus dulcis TaxID=3755 RepID=A0AAD4V2M1_PRUDU|nr:hypothetical protein L3X38_036144 [Prunus dulcis]